MKPWKDDVRVMSSAYEAGVLDKLAATAKKTDPGAWEAAKREAKAKMGGKHSARAMQLATQIYKRKGGGYSGPKPSSSSNSLRKWTSQEWKWSGGDKPGQGGKGVYLPSKKVQGLKASKAGRKRLAAAARKKSRATREGRQYSSHGLAKGTSLTKSAAKQPPGEMSKLNLKQIARQAREIDARVTNDTRLEGWIEDKITQAKAALNSVTQYMMNEEAS